jgi:hypothetical protein
MTMTLEELSAHEEIRQAIYRHFRAGDRLDAELDRTAFWDNGIFEGGPFEGPAGEHMPVLFGETLRNFFTATMHYMMNMIIDVRGNDAFVEVYATPFHIVPPESHQACFGPAKAAELDPTQSYEFHVGTRYSVKMEQRGGAWKIAVMKLIVEWTRVVPYTGWNEGGVMDILKLRGVRDRSDESYLYLP